MTNHVGEQIAHTTIEDFKALKSKATSDEPTEKDESSEDSVSILNPVADSSKSDHDSIRQNDNQKSYIENRELSDSVINVDFDRLYSDSIAYNENLKMHQHELLTNEQSYQSPALNLSNYGITSGVYGYDFNMASGAAHMTCTSLPVGGNSTNCVLSGHSGYHNPNPQQGRRVTGGLLLSGFMRFLRDSQHGKQKHCFSKKVEKRK